MGALSQALPAGGAVSLASNKSCYGHTEGAAGMTGLLLAAGALRECATPAIMHLRSPNQYVSAALEDWSRRRRSPVAAPRQAGPAPSLAALGALAGTSSFGMSGVNAHLVLALGTGTSSSGTAMARNGPGKRPWQRSRHHILVRPHALLQV